MSAVDMQTKPNKQAPSMPDEWYKKAIEVFKIPSTSYNEISMSIYILGELERIGGIQYQIDDYANIIAVKGTAEFYPCFCAHLDTVHTYPNGFRLLYKKTETRKYLFAADKDDKSVGIGGDDKCGVFTCLYLLERLDHVKIIFFSQEESGGIGSSNIELEVFDDCQFLGGVDRWNGHDFVNRYSGEHTISKAFNKDIKSLLKKHGYSFNTGLFTDSFNVMERGIDLSCFNLSCGYYSHHSKNEYVDLNELYLCCMVCEELARLSDIRYDHEYGKFSRKSFNYSNLGWDYSDWDYKAPGWSKDPVDGTWRTGAPKKLKSRFYNYDDNETVMPKTEDEFYKNYDGIKNCQNCGIELLRYETVYCTPCAEFMRKTNTVNSNTDLSI